MSKQNLERTAEALATKGPAPRCWMICGLSSMSQWTFQKEKVRKNVTPLSQVDRMASTWSGEGQINQDEVSR